jgi:hypothetical protein
MYQTRSRQIARLEKLGSTYIAQRKATEEQWQDVRLGAVRHAAVLAFLIRHGKPKIAEPLSDACQRVSESKVWKAFRDEHFPSRPPPHRYARVRPGRPFAPYSRDSVVIIGDYLRHLVISNFPGVDEKAKLNAVFKSAPPWLLWFTFADYTAAVLGLELPDLSRVTCFARSRDAFDLWWGLPPGSFEKRQWPKSLVKDPLSGTDLSLLRPQPAPRAFTTRRERERAVITLTPASSQDEWPILIPLVLLQWARESMPIIEQKKHPQFAGTI